MTPPAAESAEDVLVNGIYVFAFPTYLRDIGDDGSGETRLGIAFVHDGVALEEVKHSPFHHLREFPVLLRIYPTPDGSKEAEKRFKAGLGDMTDPEWFLMPGGSQWVSASLEFLDGIARDQGLEVEVSR